MIPKTVLITGSSRGIGAAIARKFAKEGYQLVLNCNSSKDTLYALAKELEDTFHAQVLCCIGDVSQYSFVESMFLQIKEKFEKLDVLINNAGISYVGLFTDMSISEWHTLIDTNLTSVFSCSKLAVPMMVSQKSGKIINISSIWGINGASCEVAYSASKGGINAFTKALAKELAPSNIQVNAIACGVIDTQMNACFDHDEKEVLMEEIPAGRFGSPEEVALVAYSLAEGISYLTGQIITIDGGFL